MKIKNIDHNTYFNKPISKKHLNSLCKTYNVYIQLDDSKAIIFSHDKQKTIDGSWMRKSIKDYSISDWIIELEMIA